MRLTLTEAAVRIVGVVPAPMLHRAVADVAERLAEAVRARLSGGADDAHEAPWMRSGSLRDSVAVMSDADGSVVGSAARSAAAQELGTADIPVRAFLVPVAAEMSSEIGASVGVLSPRQLPKGFVAVTGL